MFKIKNTESRNNANIERMKFKKEAFGMVNNIKSRFDNTFSEDYIMKTNTNKNMEQIQENDYEMTNVNKDKLSDNNSDKNISQYSGDNLSGNKSEGRGNMFDESKCDDTYNITDFNNDSYIGTENDGICTYESEMDIGKNLYTPDNDLDSQID